MKYSSRHGSLQSLLALGILSAMSAGDGGGGATLLEFDDLKDLDIDDIADMPLSQIADAAGFVLPPIGLYQCKLEIDFGSYGTDDKKVKCVAANWTIEKTIELENDSDIPLAEGTQFDQNWAGGGAQFFKTNFGPAGKAVGANEETTLRQLLPMLTGKSYKLFVGHRQDKTKKDDKGKPVKYISTSNIELFTG